MTCRALAIDEQSYGAKHPEVARDLNNLAQLLQATNRLWEAEPLMHRCIAILPHFGEKSGRERSNMQTILGNYRYILEEMMLPADEIDRKINDARVIAARLDPIVPEVERLLGRAESVANVLAALDLQYKAEGKPEVYFLKSDQPIAS